MCAAFTPTVSDALTNLRVQSHAGGTNSLLAHQIHILNPIMIRHNPIQITRRMPSEIRDIQIHQLGLHMVEHRVEHRQLAGFTTSSASKVGGEGKDFGGISYFNEFGGVEGVDRGELVDSREDDDGDAVGAGG